VLDRREIFFFFFFFFFFVLFVCVGPIRENEYLPAHPFDVDPTMTGFDMVDDPAVIQAHFPFVTPEARFMKHVRCAGYLNVARLGQFLLKEFTAKGGKIISGEVTKVNCCSTMDTDNADAKVSGGFFVS
jgi:hypothetical protein